MCRKTDNFISIAYKHITRDVGMHSRKNEILNAAVATFLAMCHSNWITEKSDNTDNIVSNPIAAYMTSFKSKLIILS